MAMVLPLLLILLMTLNSFVEATGNTRIATGAVDYYGIRLGYIIRSRSIRRDHPLSFISASLRGTLYCVDESTIFVRKFILEELDDNKFVKFYAVRLHRNSTWDENVIFDKEAFLDIVTGSNTPLRSTGYAGENFLLKFPEGSKITEFDGIVVLYDAFFLRTPLSDLIDIPRDLLPPRPSVLGEFQADGGFLYHRVHADSAVALNTRQIALYNFNYDGLSPSTTFWVGKGHRVDQDGTRVVGPDSDRQGWVPSYIDANITVTLPDNLTVFDIEYLSLWNVLFVLDLGHVFFNLTGKNLPPYFNNDTFVPVIPVIPVHPIFVINTFVFGENGAKASSVIALNTKQILLEEFSYYQGCSEAFFWVGVYSDRIEDGPPYVDVVEQTYYRVQRLTSPNGDGNKPLLPYYKTNVTLTLRGNLTLYDLDFFALFCDSIAEPKRIATAFLPKRERRKYDGRLPEYVGDEEDNGQTEENSERETVLNYLRKIWRNIFTCFLIFC